MLWLAQPHPDIPQLFIYPQAISGVPNGCPHSQSLSPRTMEEGLELWLGWGWAQVLRVSGVGGTGAQGWMRLKGSKSGVCRDWI